MSHPRSLLAYIGLSLSTLIAASATASMQTTIDDKVVGGLRHPLRAGAHVRISNVPLADASLQSIDLEAFDVVASDAVLAIYGDNGQVTRTRFPATRYFRGAVAGDPASMAVFAVRETGEVAGFVVNKGRKFAVSTHHFSKPEDRVLVDEVSVVADMAGRAA